MSEDLDPSEFVQRIRQLGQERDQQDAERVRKLEEEIIQGRSERLARRAERARSLSPDKPSTPQSLRSAAGTPRHVQEKAADTPTPPMEPPSQQSARDDALQRLTDSPAQVLEEVEPKKPAPSAAALGRSGTLSWQRRPQSGAGSVRRPLSAVSVSSDKNAASSPRHTPEPSSPERPTPSRNQIAQSLGAKDPSWFKQTPDRGIGSAAYRRNQDDNLSDAGSMSGRRQLPGLSRDSTAEPDASSPPPESFRSSSPSRNSSVRGSAAFSNRFSTNTSVSGGDAESIAKAKSPLPTLDSQRFAPPSEQASSVDGGDQTGSVRGLAMSPTQGRISPERTERPASPTKGMGGFVQSAMLKRSDSVNKRWSTQTPQGLSRQNSTLSNRGSATLGGYGSVSKDSRPSSLSRDNSMEPSSRPGSSSSNLTITKDAAERIATSKDEFVKPALPHHSRSKSVASTFSEKDQPQDETSPPSPSKRWSPTKSTWLESALNKPESPKPKQPPPQQPSWMAEINRRKEQRGSVDLGKNSPIQSPPLEVTPSGRSSPIKEVQLRPASLRKAEPPKSEDAPELVQSVLKPKPVPSPKPSIVVKEEAKPQETPELEKTDVSKEEAKTAPSEFATKSTPASRFSKDSPISSPTAKPKPETPPKKDFRAGLKSRQAAFEAPKNDQKAEFQNVFGRLKKTETKNYVAPDTLKDNILRGKSGLAVTGGPKPSVRRDDFKDSLVTQKAAMLAKAQETGSAAHKKSESSSQPTETPEAIAKRKALGRSDSIGKPLPPKDPETTPEAISRIQSLRTSKPVIPEKGAQPSPLSASKGPAKSNKLADRVIPDLAGMLARGPPPISSGPTPSSGEPDESTPRATLEGKKKGPAPELTHMTKGRARGPKRRAPAAKQTPAEKKTTPPKVAPVAAVPLVKPENMLPSTEVSKTNEALDQQPVIQTPVRDSLKAKPAAPAKSPDLSRKVEKSPPPELPRKPPSLDLDRKLSLEVKETPKKTAQAAAIESKPSPTASPKSSNWRNSRPLPITPAKPETRKEPPSALKEIPTPNRDISPAKDSQSPEKPAFSVKSATALWGRQSASSSPAPSRTKSPIKLPTKADEREAMEGAGLIRDIETEPEKSIPRDNTPSKTQQDKEEPSQASWPGSGFFSRASQPITSPKPQAASPKPLAPKPKPVGLGLGSFGGFIANAARSRESSPQPPLSAKQFPASPPASSDRPLSEPFKSSTPANPDNMFADFFEEAPITTGELPEHIDTIKILATTPLDLGPGGKIRTLRKQIQEITGDGKLVSIPASEEHILFQDSMYLCTHVFGDAKGARTTEVYLWSGNGVADATLEDVQLFGRNEAKRNQGRLIILRQGKETPNFFEALGGIVITRRGSRPTCSKEYMLCGRRHLGHIVFDEVDFSLKSLCSGFAYIISTEHKVFLWKGKGCSAEESSGARLMSMDLNLSGELVEVDEGSEPAELINFFPPSTAKGPAIPRSANHWSQKATAEKYRTRLFKIEQQHGSLGWGQGLQTPVTPKSPSPQSKTEVVEIMPYCQRDLEPEYIYVLDAFFEMYIIVGALSRTQSAAFSTALIFAQEYSILAVSEDDRPFVPVTTVVLEGVPRDMKAVFRFWDDALIPAAGLMSGKLGRGKSLRIVPLDKALKVTARQ